MNTEDKVHYYESVETVNAIGLKKWFKIGYESVVRKSETEDEAYKRVEKKVLQWAEEKNKPELNWKEIAGTSMAGTWITPLQTINKEDERKAIVLENIQNSQSLTQLKTFENDSMKYDLVQEYLNKKKALS